MAQKKSAMEEAQQFALKKPKSEKPTSNSHRDPVYDAMKNHGQQKFDADRSRFMAAALAEGVEGWTIHTAFHWSYMLNGSKLDYWPSRKKWQYKGKTHRGDVRKFIATRSKSKTQKKRNQNDKFN